MYLMSAVCDTSRYATIPVNVYTVYMNAQHYPLVFGLHMCRLIWNWFGE